MIVRTSSDTVSSALRSARIGAVDASPLVVEFYNKCHGKGGRFCSGQGSMRRARELASGIASKARQAERSATKLISDVVTASGGQMVDLKYRLKTVKSMTRKIANKAVEKGLPLEKMAGRISDALRYTGVVDAAQYASTVRKARATLEQKGYKVVELETHWPRGDAYNGVHMIALHPNGTKIEVQFHTPESHAAKVQNHKDYEKMRVSKDPKERMRLNKKMTDVADRAPVPKGALGLGKKVYRP